MSTAYQWRATTKYATGVQLVSGTHVYEVVQGTTGTSLPTEARKGQNVQDGDFTLKVLGEFEDGWRVPGNSYIAGEVICDNTFVVMCAQGGVTDASNQWGPVEDAAWDANNQFQDGDVVWQKLTMTAADGVWRNSKSQYKTGMVFICDGSPTPAGKFRLYLVLGHTTGETPPTSTTPGAVVINGTAPLKYIGEVSTMTGISVVEPDGSQAGNSGEINIKPSDNPTQNAEIISGKAYNWVSNTEFASGTRIVSGTHVYEVALGKVGSSQPTDTNTGATIKDGQVELYVVGPMNTQWRQKGTEYKKGDIVTDNTFVIRCVKGGITDATEQWGPTEEAEGWNNKAGYYYDGTCVWQKITSKSTDGVWRSSNKQYPSGSVFLVEQGTNKGTVYFVKPFVSGSTAPNQVTVNKSTLVMNGALPLIYLGEASSDLQKLSCDGSQAGRTLKDIIMPDSVPDPEYTPTPEPTPGSNPDNPEPQPEPTPTPQPEPEPEPTPWPQPQPDPEPQPGPTPTPTPRPDISTGTIPWQSGIEVAPGTLLKTSTGDVYQVMSGTSGNSQPKSVAKDTIIMDGTIRIRVLGEYSDKWRVAGSSYAKGDIIVDNTFVVECVQGGTTDASNQWGPVEGAAWGADDTIKDGGVIWKRLTKKAENGVWRNSNTQYPSGMVFICDYEAPQGKFRLYESLPGITGNSEPVNTTGNNFINGSAVLCYLPNGSKKDDAHIDNPDNLPELDDDDDGITPDIAGATPWQANAGYTLGQCVISNGNIYSCAYDGYVTLPRRAVFENVTTNINSGTVFFFQQGTNVPTKNSYKPFEVLVKNCDAVTVAKEGADIYFGRAGNPNITVKIQNDI